MAVNVKDIKPLGDRVLVEPIEKEEVTAGGIVLPETAKEKPQEGEVMAVGPGAINDKGERLPMNVAVGDKIIFSKYAGTEIKLDGEDFLIMAERDVLGILK